MNTYKHKVAVVTGAGGGIGYGLAHACAKEGMKLVLTAFHSERLEAHAEKLRRKFGVEVVTITGDVSVEADVKKIADFAMEKFGRVDMLFNNAGVHFHKSFELLTDNDWEFMLRCNFWSVIYGMRTFLPLIRKNKEGGNIINIAAMGSLFGSPTMTHYTAAKFANLGLSQAVLMEERIYHGDKVNIHVVMPAAIASNLMNAAAVIRKDQGRYINATEEQTDLDKQTEQMFIKIVDWNTPNRPDSSLEPEVGGDIVMQQVKEGKNFIFTHPEVAPIAEKQGKVYASGYLPKGMPFED